MSYLEMYLLTGILYVLIVITYRFNKPNKKKKLSDVITEASTSGLSPLISYFILAVLILVAYVVGVLIWPISAVLVFLNRNNDE